MGCVPSSDTSPERKEKEEPQPATREDRVGVEPSTDKKDHSKKQEVSTVSSSVGTDPNKLSDAGNQKENTRSAAERAAAQYHEHVQAKKTAEEDAIRRLKLDEFDPIRPLDSFNITHRCLLGRCWDRRREELFPIVQLWQYLHNFLDNRNSFSSGIASSDEYESPFLLNNSGNNQNMKTIDEGRNKTTKDGKEGGSSNLVPAHRDGRSQLNSILYGSDGRPVQDDDMPRFPAVFQSSNTYHHHGKRTMPHSPASPTRMHHHSCSSFQASSSPVSPASDTIESVDDNTYRIRRSSHWISVSIVANEDGNGHSGSPGSANSFSNSKLFSPTPPAPVGSNEHVYQQATSEELHDAAAAVEQVHKLSAEKREEIFTHYMMRLPRLAGGKHSFAFRLGPETSSSESTRFLRKRGLAPAKGVEVVRWNRVELMRPSLDLIGRSVARIQSTESLPCCWSGNRRTEISGVTNTGSHNLNAGVVNVSFGGNMADIDLTTAIHGSNGSLASPVGSGGGAASSSGFVNSRNPSTIAVPGAASGGFQRETSSSSQAQQHVQELGSSSVKESLFPLEAVHCHSIAFPLEALKQDAPFSTLTLAVNCFSTSVDPYQCEANGCMLYPIDIDDSSPHVLEKFGEGVITDIMYGGTMIIECTSRDGISKLEEALTSMDWKKPQALINVVKEVQEHSKKRRQKKQHPPSQTPSYTTPTTPSKSTPQFRILRRIGGRPIRDAVELSEINVLLGDGGDGEPTEELQTILHPDGSTTNVNSTNPSASMTSQVNNVAYSRVASAWMGMNTMIAALRTWVLHLLSNPEYSQPISLYLQKFAGIATAMKMTTVDNSVSFHRDARQINLNVSSPVIGRNDISGGAENGDDNEEESETTQVMDQIFCPEMNLEPYIHSTGDGGLGRRRRRRRRRRHIDALASPTVTPKLPWMPPRGSNAHNLFDILENLASSSSSSSSVSSNVSSSPVSPSSLPSTGSTVTNPQGWHHNRNTRRPSKINTSLEPKKGGPSRRSVTRSLLRAAGSASSLNQVLNGNHGGLHHGQHPHRKNRHGFDASCSTMEPVTPIVPLMRMPTERPTGVEKKMPATVTPVKKLSSLMSGEEDAWNMAMLELKALQRELEDLKRSRERLHDEREQAIYALDTLTNVFVPSLHSRVLLPTLLNLRVAVRFPDELHADVLQVSGKDWFPILIAVWSSPRCRVRRVRVATPLTGKDLPKLGMLAGLLYMGYGGRSLTSLEFDASHLFTQGSASSNASPLGGSRLLLGGMTGLSNNHGLPTNTPPFCINGEQARDTLWVLLSAMAEASETGNVQLVLKDLLRPIREGSFHSLGSFFRSKTYKPLSVARHETLWFTSATDASKKNTGASVGARSAGTGLKKEEKADGGCCGGSSADKAPAKKRSANNNASSPEALSPGNTIREVIKHYKGPNHGKDAEIEAALDRASRTAVEPEEGAAGSPRLEVYPFYSILCHPCRCVSEDDDEDDFFEHGVGEFPVMDPSNGSSEKVEQSRGSEYRNVYNNIHNHEGYAKNANQQLRTSEHHLPPMPYFPPPESDTDHSLDNSAAGSPAMPASLPYCSPVRPLPSYRGGRGGGTAGRGAGSSGRGGTAAGRSSNNAPPPHWHFGYPSYDEEEAEMKRSEQAVYSEGKDILDSLEDAVRLFNRQEKPFHISIVT